MSVIFYHDEKQMEVAKASIDKIQKTKNRKVVTKLLPAKEFHLAEDYHQKYFLTHLPELIKRFGFSPHKLVTSPLATKLNGYVAGEGLPLKFKEEMKAFNLSDEDILEIKKAFN
eukprot:TRINITY_DN794_c0_g1_i1.p1 TRINITY_DN794_c0_g1~~TRINITY_DN794_c0_g1_i1.p1  ORF type:complete len:114 (+),score=42.74 TRINITY_DN794_c0_g1_i1:298-639(+)